MKYLNINVIKIKFDISVVEYLNLSLKLETNFQVKLKHLIIGRFFSSSNNNFIIIILVKIEFYFY